jgi:hypothetical protein
MAGRGRTRQDNYFKNKQDAEVRSGQRSLNIGLAVAEELGIPSKWEIQDSPEISDAPRTAPTTNPSRPRALKIAYSKSAQKLVIRFRDNTWWEYRDIPVDMWNDLKASDSTGKYLAASGLDKHDSMGPFNPDDMSPEDRVLFNA